MLPADSGSKAEGDAHREQGKRSAKRNVKALIKRLETENKELREQLSAANSSKALLRQIKRERRNFDEEKEEDDGHGEAYFSGQLADLQQQLEEANEERNRLMKQCEVLQISLDEIRTGLTGERDRAKMKEATVKQQLHMAEEQLMAARQEVRTLQRQVLNMHDQVAVTEERLATQVNYSQEKELAIEKLKKDVERAQHKTRQVDTARKRAEDRCVELSMQIGPLTQALQLSTAQLEDADLERRQLRERLVVLENHLQQGQRQFDQQTGTFAEFVQLRRQVALLQQDNSQLSERLAHLKGRLKSNFNEVFTSKPTMHLPMAEPIRPPSSSQSAPRQRSSSESQKLCSQPQRMDFLPDTISFCPKKRSASIGAMPSSQPSRSYFAFSGNFAYQTKGSSRVLESFAQDKIVSAGKKSGQLSM